MASYKATKTGLRVGINIQMQDDGKTVRYAQSGIMTAEGFTGMVSDYVGGGQYQCFYYIDGKAINDDEDECLGDGTIKEMMEEKHPGIVDALYGIRDKYIDVNEVDWIFMANKRLLRRLATLPKDRLFSAGRDITPITCTGGFTIFDRGEEEGAMDYASYIRHWHSDHDDNSPFPDCRIYQAIQKGATDEAIIAIAEETDPGIRDAYEEYREYPNPPGSA